MNYIHVIGLLIADVWFVWAVSRFLADFKSYDEKTRAYKLFEALEDKLSFMRSQNCNAEQIVQTTKNFITDGKSLCETYVNDNAYPIKLAFNLGGIVLLLFIFFGMASHHNACVEQAERDARARTYYEIEQELNN